VQQDALQGCAHLAAIHLAEYTLDKSFATRSMNHYDPLTKRREQGLRFSLRWSGWLGLALMLSKLLSKTLLRVRNPLQGAHWNLEFPIAKSAGSNGGNRAKPLEDSEITRSHRRSDSELLGVSTLWGSGFSSGQVPKPLSMLAQSCFELSQDYIQIFPLWCSDCLGAQGLDPII
jgi:hypothetical protein